MEETPRPSGLDPSRDEPTSDALYLNGVFRHDLKRCGAGCGTWPRMPRKNFPFRAVFSGVLFRFDFAVTSGIAHHPFSSCTPCPLPRFQKRLQAPSRQTEQEAVEELNRAAAMNFWLTVWLRCFDSLEDPLAGSRDQLLLRGQLQTGAGTATGDRLER